MTRCSGGVLLGLLVLSVSAGARAQETACMEPPEFVGCPTGAPAFNLSGEPDKAGVVRYLNVGDELIVTGGEGAMESVSIWRGLLWPVASVRRGGPTGGREPGSIEEADVSSVRGGQEERVQGRRAGAQLSVKAGPSGAFQGDAA